MIRKTLGDLYLLAGTVITVVAATEVIRDKMQRLAETEQVDSARDYVLVRLARGDYFKAGAVKAMKTDYDFYKIITKPID